MSAALSEAHESARKYDFCTLDTWIYPGIQGSLLGRFIRGGSGNMRGLYLGALLLLLPAWAFAQPTIDIVSPQSNSCVNNGNEIYTGGVLGGQARPEKRDVPVELRLREAAGRELVLTFEVEYIDANGQQVQRNWQEIFDFAPGEIDAIAEFEIMTWNIEDGTDRVLTITVTDPDGGNDQEATTFRLDREPPDVQIQQDDLDAVIGACSLFAPAFPDITVVDNQDPNPVFEVDAPMRNGCQRTQVLRVVDDCGVGNAQEFPLNTAIPADPDDIRVSIRGVSCGFDACPTEGNDVVEFDDGGRIARPAITYHVEAMDGVDSVLDCVSRVTASLCTLDENGEVAGGCVALIPGEPIDEPGDYRASVTVGSCDYEDLDGNGVLDVGEDQNGNGVLDGLIGSDQIEFTVLEKPTAVPGGPYEVPQGTPLVLDGSESTSPAEIGEIIEWSWDLDGDRFFSRAEVFDVPTVPFDTTQGDGVYNLRLRVRARNALTGEEVVDYTNFQVTVTDVSPSCDAGGPYQATEGVPIGLNGTGSIAGHESDEIRAYHWDFGDGVRPQFGQRLSTPTHIFPENSPEGEPFIVTLRVEDPDSSTECTTEVTVSDVDPVIRGIGVLSPNNPVEGDRVTFTVGQTAPGNGDDPIVDYAWSFIEGQTLAQCAVNRLAACNGPNLRRPDYVYADQSDENGYQVCLTVTDEDSSASDCFPVVVQDLEPTAYFEGFLVNGFDGNVPRLTALDGGVRIRQGDTLWFNAEGSMAGGEADPLRANGALVWDFGDGSNLLEKRANELTVQHTFTQDGVYTVQLRVRDEDSSAIFEQVYIVEDARPEAHIDLIYNNPDEIIYEGPNGCMVSSAESVAGSETDPITGYEWDMGDGEIVGPLGADQNGFAHGWPDDGAYELHLTAIDSDGSRDSATVVIEVANLEPEVTVELHGEVSPQGTLQVELGQTVHFTTGTVLAPAVVENIPSVVLNVSDVEADLPPSRVAWDFDCNPATPAVEAFSTQYTFNDLGVLALCTEVDDGDGGITHSEILVEVTPAAPQIENLPDQVTMEGQRLSFEVVVFAPRINANDFGALAVDIVDQPPDSNVERIQEEQNIRFALDWTPTFYDSGSYQFVLQARSGDATRERVINIEVQDGGTPRLVAGGVGGNPNRGVLNFYDYERDGFSVRIRFAREVDIGFGFGGMAVESTNRRVWATSPNSDHVAVVSAGELPRVIRRVPVGETPVAIVEGGDHMWVLNQDSETLSIISKESLKVEYTATLDGISGPADMAWVPAREEAEARIVIVDRNGGTISLVDPEMALVGIPPVVGSSQIGAVLTRVVLDETTGALFVADAKARRIYRMTMDNIMNGGAPDVGIPLDFAARDLLAQDGVLWAATGNALAEINGDDVSLNEFIPAAALGVVDANAVAGGAMAVVTSNRIENYSVPAMQRITDTAGTRIRRVATYVAPR